MKGSNSLTMLRLRARLPRYLALATLAVLCVAGLRAAVAGPPEEAPAQPAGDVADVAAHGFAESFARAYLTWDAHRPEGYERRLQSFMVPGLAAEIAPALPASGGGSVSWTAVASEQRLATGRTLVTVAADTASGTVHLAVPVSRDTRGFLSVDAAPAVVGPPPVARSGGAAGGREVESTGLTAVVTRALRNYLAGARRNLLADLAPEAVVSLPAQALAVRSLEPPTWVVPSSRVAVAVEAERPDGVVPRLRYELEVVRSDRWYVRSIGTDPVDKGGSR